MSKQTEKLESEDKMRAVINRKRYDTNTADKIADWSNGHNRSDFYFFEETLCRTKVGAWFIHGEGGALSAYATRTTNSSGWGEEITPLDESEALQWCQDHGAVDVIDKYFGELVTDA